MAGKVDILCLANSEKHGQRCLAGVRLDTGGWIRPVSTREGGALFEDQYTTESGKVVQPLDSVRIHFDQYSPKYHQPENWLISNEKSWELLNTELNKPQLLALNTALQRKGKIFSTKQNSRPKTKLKENLSTRSLTLIRPQDVNFYIETNNDRNNQPRTEFDFDGYHYNLPITDPRWRQRVNGENPDDLPSVNDLDDDEEVLFTISLGEAFEGFCYKIVAAIFSLDEELIVDL
jgi:hypothetical protein